jgi:hypothetical protein
MNENEKDNDSFEIAILNMNRSNIQDNKRQQWQITYYYLLICGFIFAYCKYVDFKMTVIEKGICYLVPVIALIAAVSIIVMLHVSMVTNRNQVNNIYKNIFNDKCDKYGIKKDSSPHSGWIIMIILLATIITGYTSIAIILASKVEIVNTIHTVNKRINNISSNMPDVMTDSEMNEYLSKEKQILKRQHDSLNTGDLLRR